tara:strand:+ start:366 stop:1211 length:846 start_codon:yes stop_codon:yes gene_type:complete
MTTNIKAEHGWLINAGNSQSLYKQAAASAMTLKINQKMPVAVCIDRADNWPDEYEDCVDYIVEYPFSDTSASMPYPQLNQWQLYHVTPFKNNVLIEADTLVLSNMDYIWHLGNTNVQLPKSVVDFRNVPWVPPTAKIFNENKLKILHAGIWFFKAQNDESEKYFKMLDVVSQNWRDAFKTYFKPEHVLEWPDLDTLHCVTMKMLDEYDLFTVTDSNLLRYTLMLNTVESKWNDVMNTWYTHSFKIDNYRQNGVLKYTEPSVMSEKILNGIRNHYRSSVAKT